jgi:hypothetical protein
MEIASDMAESDDDSNHHKTAEGDNGYSDPIAMTKHTPDILLDSATHSEEEDIDLEDESSDAGTEDGDVDTEEEELEFRPRENRNEGLVGFKDGFDGVELGFVPPPPAYRTGDRGSQRYTAGCVWTAEDWSCSYDAVFMAFWSIYEQSSIGWRNRWIRHIQDWNMPLGNNYDHLIILADTPVSGHDYTGWFSRYRDRFREQLSRTDPESFPRRGPLPASASRILGLMFGRDTGPYLEQHLICSACGALSVAELETCFLTAGLGRDRGTPISLHTIWERFVQRFKTDPAQLGAVCSRCHDQNKVQALTMPDVPWIWFERERHSPVGPSLTLTFNSQPQRLGYSLRAIIYAGGNHFTTRFRERSGRWWKHDGRVFSGVPQPDNIQSEAELFTNDSRFACILIYRRDDD